MPVVPPTGVPSELLHRRPDIQQAEYDDRGGLRQRRRRAEAALSVAVARRERGDRRAAHQRRVLARSGRRLADQRCLLWPAGSVFDRGADGPAHLQRRPDQVGNTPRSGRSGNRSQSPTFKRSIAPLRKSPTTLLRTTSRACEACSWKITRVRRSIPFDWPTNATDNGYTSYLGSPQRGDALVSSRNRRCAGSPE